MTDTESPNTEFLGASGPQMLDPGRGAGEQIFDHLRRAILNMDIAPGSRISEAMVARHFAASRTPVREAMQRLSDAGLVVTQPSRGNYVTRLSELRIRDARFIREALEVAAVGHLCREGIDDTHADGLIECLKQQKASVEEGDRDRFHALDDLFHLDLARATGCDRLARLLEREKMVLDRLRVLSLADAAHRRLLLDQHAGILEAILTRDGDAASALMRDHLGVILQTLARVRDRHGAYFE